MNVALAGILALFQPEEDKPAFYTNMGGRMRLQTARQNETFPYCVYSLIGNSNDTWFGDEVHEVLTIQFSIFSNESSAVNICAYFENLKALYDECVLTVSGYTALRMERTWAYLLRDDPNNVWQYVVQYRLLLEKTIS